MKTETTNKLLKVSSFKVSSFMLASFIYFCNALSNPQIIKSPNSQRTKSPNNQIPKPLTNPKLNELPKLAKDKHIENKKFFDKLKKKQPKNLDYLMQDLHDAEFKKTNCLNCANCCKTTGPLFTLADIERISKHLRQKPQQFIDQYLRVDEDKDYVLQSVPCAFLATDNSCLIYEVRPKACREFPHTDRKKFHQIADLTMQNISICPAVYNIIEEMKRRIL